MRLSIFDFLLALSVPVIWGMGFTFAKAALGEFPPLFMMSMRFTLTALILCWFFPPPTVQFRILFLLALVCSSRTVILRPSTRPAAVQFESLCSLFV